MQELRINERHDNIFCVNLIIYLYKYWKLKFRQYISSMYFLIKII